MKLPFLVLLLLASCSGYHDLSPSEVNDLLAQKEERDLFVLNVHTPFEGQLNGTDAIIEDWQNIGGHQDELPVDKSQPILVYCRTGRMSTSAVEQLRELGYKNSYHLKGGMIAYDQAGYVVLDKSWTS